MSEKGSEMIKAWGKICMNISLPQNTGDGYGSREPSDYGKMYNESTKLCKNVSIKMIIKYCLKAVTHCDN